ncbi:MAG TPA: hypothetical protein VK217_03830 [Acidimicrobiales bacterium]|nr:hypothetical protein [Acidimicrobiales bacterium]
MRPYPDELLRSLRHSLREVVIPAIEEPWPRYVAKAMEKLLEHLELRALHEERLLAEDITELDEVLGSLAESFADPSLASSAALSAWRALPLPGSATGALGHRGESGAGVAQAQGLQALNEGNEARRAHLVAAIEAMDTAERDDALETALAECRARVRTYLRRELDRDVLLTRPTFMSFGPPVARTEGAGA